MRSAPRIAWLLLSLQWWCRLRFLLWLSNGKYSDNVFKCRDIYLLQDLPEPSCLQPRPPVSFLRQNGGNEVAKQGPDSCRGRGNSIAETGLYFPFLGVMRLPTMEAQGHSVLFKGVLDFQADQDHNKIYLCLVIDSGTLSQQNKRLETNLRLLVTHLLSPHSLSLHHFLLLPSCLWELLPVLLWDRSVFIKGVLVFSPFDSWSLDDFGPVAFHPEPSCVLPKAPRRAHEYSLLHPDYAHNNKDWTQKSETAGLRVASGTKTCLTTWF